MKAVILILILGLLGAAPAQAHIHCEKGNCAHTHGAGNH